MCRFPNGNDKVSLRDGFFQFHMQQSLLYHKTRGSLYLILYIIVNRLRRARFCGGTAIIREISANCLTIGGNWVIIKCIFLGFVQISENKGDFTGFRSEFPAG